jgi:hypothetical protein
MLAIDPGQTEAPLTWPFGDVNGSRILVLARFP